MRPNRATIRRSHEHTIRMTGEAERSFPGRSAMVIHLTEKGGNQGPRAWVTRISRFLAWAAGVVVVLYLWWSWIKTD
jgi:hypothetical protein